MTKRKPNPHWLNHKGQSPEERRQRAAQSAATRNAIAKAHGYPNMGALIADFCKADKKVRNEIVKMLRGEQNFKPGGTICVMGVKYMIEMDLGDNPHLTRNEGL